MIKTKAIFERKADEFQLNDCIIEQIIHLEASEFDMFSKNMLKDYEFIKNSKEQMYIDGNGIFHCILVVGEGKQDGILIEAEGYDYARYSAFLPNAADFLSVHLKQKHSSKMTKTDFNFKLEPTEPKMKMNL